MNQFTELDYIANLMHEDDCKERRIIGPRWWCLREEAREKYRKAARESYSSWAADESKTERRMRGKFNGVR